MKTQASFMKAGPNLKRICAFAVVLSLCLLGALLFWRRSGAAHGQARASFSVRSASFSNGGAIPRQYTCDGADLSPHLAWQSAPASAKSFAIVMDDPDAPVTFTHWLVYNIAPGVQELAEGASTEGTMPSGSAEGTNNFGRLGYGGPCPPRGSSHHYIFRVYALDVLVDLPAGAGRRQLDEAMGSHIVSQGQVIGTYQR